MAKREKATGATQVERHDVEQPADDDAGEALSTGEHATPADLATPPPQDEPGPEDFERHAGARLLADHGTDLRLQEEIEVRLRKRGHVIATKLQERGANATVVINGAEYQARKRPDRSGGGMLLAEASKRVAASFD